MGQGHRDIKGNKAADKQAEQTGSHICPRIGGWKAGHRETRGGGEDEGGREEEAEDALELGVLRNVSASSLSSF